MEEAKAMAAQQQLIQQQNQQQQQRQQFMLLQQFQKQQAHQQASAISRFPSNIDAHLRPPGLPHRPGPINLHQNPNPNPPNSLPSFHPNPNSNPPPSQPHPQQLQPQPQPQPQSQPQPQPQPQQRPIRPGNQAELQMAYQDAWRVCHPDFKRPFTSLEDACERLLPYHVVADYEAEEDDRILDSDPTGQILSRSQQWDHNIAAKVAEFTATFEKQALAFNLISRKRALGEFRSEERLMIEQALLQEEKRAILELKAEMDTREKAGREAHEAKMRMAAMAQAEQTQLNPNARAEMMIRTPIRSRALGTQGGEVPIGHDLSEHEQFHPEELPNGWGTNTQRDDKDPSDNLLNDEETANGEAGIQDSWREVGEFDLNSR